MLRRRFDLLGRRGCFGLVVRRALERGEDGLLRVCGFDDRVDAEGEQLLSFMRGPAETDDPGAAGADAGAVGGRQSGEVGREEHGGGFGKTQAHMLRAAEELCRELVRAGRPLIDDAQAQRRLARTYANVQVSHLLGWRALWCGVEKKPSPAYGPMAKMFSSEKFLSDAADLLDLTAPASLSKRQGPAGFLNQCYRHAHGTRIYGGTSQVHRSMIAERNLGLPRSRG